MKKISVPPYTVGMFSPGEPCGRIVYLHMEIEKAEEVWARLQGKRPFLAAVEGIDWNRDMSPWPGPRAFKGGEDFSGGAHEYLKTLTELIIPETERETGAEIRSRGIAGYSLAGLFAVWSLYDTDIFDRAASMSGSLWYDGFIEFMRRESPGRVPEKMYFSLGDREKNARSSRMAAVERCTLAAAELMEKAGAETVFISEPGGHFNDGEGRVARGIEWISQ